MQVFSTNLEHWRKRRRIFLDIWYTALRMFSNEMQNLVFIGSTPSQGGAQRCAFVVIMAAGMSSVKTLTGGRLSYSRSLGLRQTMQTAWLSIRS